MNNGRSIPNPFYAARFKRVATLQEAHHRPVYARLPRAPRNSSPVPHLTSLYHFHRAGEYGDRGYPGNCGGNLIKDLLLYFRPDGIVLDPMSGSGTCRDVCDELGIPCMSWDIHRGIDACDPHGFSPNEMFAFIWAHPPYWRHKLYCVANSVMWRPSRFPREAVGQPRAGGHIIVATALCNGAPQSSLVLVEVAGLPGATKLKTSDLTAMNYEITFQGLLPDDL
jgi:hypothetical protein